MVQLLEPQGFEKLDKKLLYRVINVLDKFKLAVQLYTNNFGMMSHAVNHGKYSEKDKDHASELYNYSSEIAEELRNSVAEILSFGEYDSERILEEATVLERTSNKLINLEDKFADLYDKYFG